MILETLVEKTPVPPAETQRFANAADRRIHAGLFLAAYAAMTNVVGENVLSTPLMEVGYDHTNHRVDVNQSGGWARRLEPGHYVITAADAIFTCHNRDKPLIFEGPTGCGKTFTTETYFKTLLPDGNTVVMSLSHNSFTDSPKAPFEDSKMVNGMPKTFIDEKSLRSVACMYIDELNLGNPNDLLQLSEGRVLVSNGRGKAGIVIPKITKEGVSYEDEENIKRLWVAGSQNPPRTRDAQFTGTELSASMKNRFLVLQFPKIVNSVGSTMWLAERKNDLHGRFLNEVAQRYEDMTGVKIARAELEQDWLATYAFVMDRTRTEKAIIKSSLEFGDLVMQVLSGEMVRTYQIEKEIAEDMGNYAQAANFKLNDSISSTQEVARVQEILNSFDKPFTERDDAHLKDMSDMFSTLRDIKEAWAQAHPLEAYLGKQHYITVEDVAAGATLLARNKQTKFDKDPVTIVNSALKAYTGLMDDLASRIRLKGYKAFDTQNFNIGLKFNIYTAALSNAAKTTEIIAKIDASVAHLRNLVSGNEVRRLMIGRTVADLATACAFMKEHEADIDAYLKSNPDTGKRSWEVGVRRYIQDLHEQKAQNPLFPDVYKHRLPRVL